MIDYQEEQIREDYEPFYEGRSRLGFQTGFEAVRVGRAKADPEILPDTSYLKVWETTPNLLEMLELLYRMNFIILEIYRQ